MPDPDPELPDPELPEPELPEPELPDPELPDPELPEPELPEPELSEPGSSEACEPSPAPIVVTGCPESSPRSIVVAGCPESSPRSTVVPGPPPTAGSFRTLAVATLVVVIAGVVEVVLVGIVVVVGESTGAVLVGWVGPGSSGDAGLLQTDADVGAPRFGKRLSLMAYTAPAELAATTTATAATDSGAVRHDAPRPVLAP